MHGLRARSGEKLRTTGYRDLPALDSGSFGQNHQQGPRVASLGVGSSSAQHAPAATVSTTSTMARIADVMMYHTMKEELIRRQEATKF